jgi:hypothetical protein
VIRTKFFSSGYKVKGRLFFLHLFERLLLSLYRFHFVCACMRTHGHTDTLCRSENWRSSDVRKEREAALHLRSATATAVCS